MADSKYTRYVQTFPKTFRPQDGDEVLNNIPAADRAGMTIAQLWQANVANPVLNAVLRGFAEADDTIAEQIQNTKATLFVKTAENQFLDVIASSLGVSRPGSLGLADSAFQNLIPALSLRPKQIRQSFYNAMDAFYGPEFSRANLITVGNGPFDIQFSATGANPFITDTISFLVDNQTIQSGIIRSTDVATSGAMTALELNTFLTNNFTGVTSEVITDPITDAETIRLRTNTPGLRGSLTYSSVRQTTATRTDTISAKVDATQTIILDGVANRYLTGDVLTIATTSGATATLEFTILNVQEDSPIAGQTSLLLNNDITTVENTLGAFIQLQVRNETITLFPTEKAELLKQEQRTAVYEISPNEVVIELPAVIPTLARGLKGALHVHNGPLINNLISTGETTPYVLPENLFENSTLTIDFPPGTPGNISISAINSVTGSFSTLLVSALLLRAGDIITVNDLLNFPDRFSTERGTFVIESIDTTDPTTGVVTLVDGIGNIQTFDAVSQAVRENAYSVTSNETWFTYEFNNNPNDIGLTTQADRTVFLAPPAAQEIDVYGFTVTNASNTSESFQFYVRLQDPLNLPADSQIWEGAFIFDIAGDQTPFVVSGESAQILGDAITGSNVLAAGKVFPRVTVEPSTNTLPTTSGTAVIGFGSSTQEPSLITYRGRASDNIIELDPSFIFTNSQPAGTFINIVSQTTPFVPDRLGNAYPIYLTSTTDARIIVQGILQSLAAAGITLTFVILAPDYKYLVDNPYLTTDDAPLV